MLFPKIKQHSLPPLPNFSSAILALHFVFCLNYKQLNVYNINIRVKGVRCIKISCER